MKPNRDAKLDTSITRLASIVASIALVLSLVPVQGLAETYGEAMEPAPNAAQEGQAPSGPAEGTSTDQSAPQSTEGGAQTAPAATPQQGETGGAGQFASDPTPKSAEDSNRKASANLADFLTKAQILDTEDEDGTTTVEEGATYKVRLSFDEGTDEKEFAEEGELTLKLPEGFDAADEQPAAKDAFMVAYSDDDGEHPIEMAKDSWWVDGDTIHVAWRVRDAESRSKEEVDEALKTFFALDDVEFDLDVVGTFATDATEVDFGTGAIRLKVNPAREDGEGEQDDEEEGDGEEEGRELEDPDAIANEFVYEDEQVLVTATTTYANRIPADATLVVSRVDGQSSSLYLSALNASASNASEYDEGNTLLYDVSFNWYGQEVQPEAGDVKVSFEFKQGQLSNGIGAQGHGFVEVNHVPVTDGVPSVEPVGASVSVGDETASFLATGFSVYTFSYTVDFTYNGYTYALPGQGDVRLSSLFVALGINRNVADVASVTFTDPQLLSVGRELVGSDWCLVSLKPFSTFETLSVVMTNGDVYQINVVDSPAKATRAAVGGKVTNATLASEQSGKAVLKVAKEVVGGNYKGGEKFAFKLEKTSYSTSQTDVLPENTTVNVRAGATDAFGPITYSEAGTYIYTITEVKPAKPTRGMAYDTEAKYAFVFVDSDLKTTVYYVNTWDPAPYEKLSPEDRASKFAQDLADGTLFEVFSNENLKVTNTFFEDGKTPQLTVRKVVVSTHAQDKARGYGFKVTLSNKKVSGTYGDMTFRDGVATFTLKHGEDKRAIGLPLDSNSKLSYKVEETDSGGLRSKMGKPITSSSGNAQYVTCTNVYRSSSGRLERKSRMSYRGTLGRSSSRSALSKTRSALSKTSDDTNTVIPMVLLALGAVGVAGGVIYRRRKQR